MDPSPIRLSHRNNPVIAKDAKPRKYRFISLCCIITRLTYFVNLFYRKKLLEGAGDRSLNLQLALRFAPRRVGQVALRSLRSLQIGILFVILQLEAGSRNLSQVQKSAAILWDCNAFLELVTGV